MDEMKASDLIARLHALVEEHGDLPVTFNECAAVREVTPYDADGNSTETMVEFCIHGW